MSINTLSVATQGLRAPNPQNNTLTIATLGWRYTEQRVAPTPQAGSTSFTGTGGWRPTPPLCPPEIPISAFIEAAMEIGEAFADIEERRIDTLVYEAQIASLEIASVVDGDKDRAKYTAGVIALATEDDDD